MIRMSIVNVSKASFITNRPKNARVGALLKMRHLIQIQRCAKNVQSTLIVAPDTAFLNAEMQRKYTTSKLTLATPAPDSGSKTAFITKFVITASVGVRIRNTFLTYMPRRAPRRSARSSFTISINSPMPTNYFSLLRKRDYWVAPSPSHSI